MNADSMNFAMHVVWGLLGLAGVVAIFSWRAKRVKRSEDKQ